MYGLKYKISGVDEEMSEETNSKINKRVWEGGDVRGFGGENEESLSLKKVKE